MRVHLLLSASGLVGLNRREYVLRAYVHRLIVFRCTFVPPGRVFASSMMISSQQRVAAPMDTVGLDLTYWHSGNVLLRVSSDVWVF